MQLGIIRNPKVGCGDRNTAHLFFEIKISEHAVSLQVFPLRSTEALEILDNVTELRYLDGHPCWVEVKGNSMSWIRLALM